MSSLILGGGSSTGVSIGGDIGGTSASPQVTGSHFGGSAGNFWVNRAGLWVPDTIKSTDLPPISQLANGTNTITIGTDGVLSIVAPAATLGALQTNVASQYLNGNNTEGYCRVTVSATAVAANSTIAIITFSAVLNAQAQILLSPVVTTNAQFGDSVAPSSVSNGPIFALLTQATNTAPTQFSIRCTNSLAANGIYGFFYRVRE